MSLSYLVLGTIAAYMVGGVTYLGTGSVTLAGVTGIGTGVTVTFATMIYVWRRS